MKILEAKIQYTIIQLGEVQPLDRPARVVEYMTDALEEYMSQEQFWVISLDRKNKPIGRTLVTVGTATASLVHPREVFRPAILQSATGIVCVHNHPSGDPSPSQADIRATRQLREASGTVQIDLLDHIILGNREDDPNAQGYYSFAESGLL
ncbi:hypothetical protein G0Q06_12935 [Puniceicoccales bacterium CK1056]|uniref:MPN domain-containing protein n=1 Tax=Oceanipulchritudo coccoides TaxID=2706888 RepID=A0A6B2M3N2_9BACT|nr:JAB domain-containing protein [Oceanipulchritudo coccoides]NDV63363.1 hypothetical protein [Oceanipulchritudo coccoides]